MRIPPKLNSFLNDADNKYQLAKASSCIGIVLSLVFTIHAYNMTGESKEALEQNFPNVTANNSHEFCNKQIDKPLSKSSSNDHVQKHTQCMQGFKKANDDYKNWQMAPTIGLLGLLSMSALAYRSTRNHSRFKSKRSALEDNHHTKEF